ncbi:AMP-dependent synthetase [Streptomyces badius]
MSAAQSPVDNRPVSVAHLFLSRVEATPGQEAYRYPVAAGDGAEGTEQWRSLTWAQTAERVHAIAAGLLALGVRPEERVAISSSTRVEWILADLGAMCPGAATTAVYPSTSMPTETVYILSDSRQRRVNFVGERRLQLDTGGLRPRAPARAGPRDPLRSGADLRVHE